MSSAIDSYLIVIITAFIFFWVFFSLDCKSYNLSPRKRYCSKATQLANLIQIGIVIAPVAGTIITLIATIAHNTYITVNDIAKALYGGLLFLDNKDDY